MIDLFEKIKLPFRKDKELFLSLRPILGFFPRNINLYKQALSHSSLRLHERDGHRLNNERLEFLGDAIIEAVTSDMVYRQFKNKREGFLTNTRSKLVQRETLNKIAREIGLEGMIRQANKVSTHTNIGGNALEAIVGAIYLDLGYKYCMRFLKQRIFIKGLDVESLAKKEVDFKSRLQEWTQHNRLRLAYSLKESGGSDARDTGQAFTAVVEIEGVECGRGTGFSKKESQQKAALATLAALNNDKELVPSILKSKERRTAMEAELVSVPPRVYADGNIGRRTRQRRKAAAGKRDQAADKAKKPTENPQAADNTQQKTGNSRHQTRQRPRRPRKNASRQDDNATRDRQDTVVAEAEGKAFNTQ